MTLTPEQQKIRSNGIGGSEIAAVVGLHDYATPLSVWVSKTGRVKDLAPSAPMILGTHLGPGLARAYAEVSGRTITCIGSDEVTHRHPDKPLAVATPDGIISADDETLETKFPDPRNWHRWGRPGTDEVPRECFLQCVWTCGVVGARATTVVMPANGCTVYRVPFDAELFETLYARAERFWQDHVIADVPPPATGMDIDLLNRVYPRHADDKAINPSDIMRLNAAEYDRMRASIKESKEILDDIGAAIKSDLGDANICEDGGYKITWRNNRDRVRVDYRQAAMDAGIDLDKYTTTEPGARVLRVTWKDEK